MPENLQKRLGSGSYSHLAHNLLPLHPRFATATPEKNFFPAKNKSISVLWCQVEADHRRKARSSQSCEPPPLHLPPSGWVKVSTTKPGSPKEQSRMEDTVLWEQGNSGSDDAAEVELHTPPSHLHDLKPQCSVWAPGTHCCPWTSREEADRAEGAGDRPPYGQCPRQCWG